MITVVPKPTNVTTFPTTVATEGSEEFRVQAPGDVEVGNFILREVTLPPENEASSNGPIIGFIAVMVSVFCVDVCKKVLVASWVAFMVTVPPSSKLMTFPLRVAME